MATAKISITLDQSLLAAVRELVGHRGLSRYVNQALRHQVQRDRLAGLLAEMEREAGPIEPRVMEEVRRSWPAPGKIGNPSHNA